MIHGLGPQIDTTKADGWRMLRAVLYGLGGIAGCGLLNLFLN